MKETIQCPHCGLTFEVSLSHRKKRIHRRPTAHKTMKQKREIDPQELQQLVWDNPLPELARLYGISQKELENCCKAFGIPIPPRGYWIGLESSQGFQEEQK